MDPRDNVILIMCDQMRGDALGVDGHPDIDTPNLDYFASTGTRFNHAYSAVPSCIPARAILWTGQDQWHAGILGMGRGSCPIPSDYPHTLPGELTRAGYQTHLVGKGHFNPQRASMGFESAELDESGRMEESEHRTWFRAHAPAGVTPDDHGVSFNSWHARPWHTHEHLHPTHWTMSRAMNFLAARDPSRPFFLNISFARPHSPYVPPPWYFDLYYRSEKRLKARVGDWANMHDDPHGAFNPNAWRGRMSPEAIHRARSGYYGEISFIDTQIGRLINWMSRQRDEAFGRTWFIFISDHGDMLGDHHLWRKTYAYEGSARIPFLVIPPAARRKDGSRGVAGEVVELRDIMPTVLDIAGAPIPATVDGRSVLPLMRGPCSDWRSYLHGEHAHCYSHEQEMQYVTDGLRKYIWFPRTGLEQFFDLESDPGECRNLIDDPARRDDIAHWRDRLVRELEARDCGWVKDGHLHCPDDEPLISPYRDRRRTAGEA